MTDSQKKSELVAELAKLVGLKEIPPMSTGSTEPRAIFDLVSEALGLGFEKASMTKPEIAAEIVRSAGMVWLPTYESRGGTVTREGLEQVVLAVKFFLGETPIN
jgi:hypothetical protein